MSKAPTVSVVMSVYNGEQFLQEAISSIDNQTHKDYEFLIINDGSTDNSLGIIKNAQEKNPRIQIINQTNSGLVTSLNKAISVAAGTYIARMDADDISMPKRLEKQIKFLDSNPNIDLVGTGFIFFNSTAKELGRQGVLTDDIDIKRELCIRNPYGHGSIMMRRKSFVKLGGYTDKVGPLEDYELWLRFAQESKLGGIPDFLYKWRINPTGISQTNAVYQKSKTTELAAAFRKKYSSDVSLFYILKRKRHYKSTSAESYLRFMEDQQIFCKLYVREHRLINAAKSVIVIISAPKFLMGQILVLLSKLKSKSLFMLVKAIRKLR